MGILIDDFLADSSIPAGYESLFTDEKIKAELTENNGDDSRYVYLVHVLIYNINAMHKIIPAVDEDHRMYKDLKDLRGLSDKVFNENNLFVVAGFAVKSIADPDLRAKYGEIFTTSRINIKSYAMEYFKKIEKMKDDELVFRAGMNGRFGDLYQMFTSQKVRYRNGEVPEKGTFARRLFTSVNSSWYFVGENKMIHNLNYYVDIESFEYLQDGVIKR